MTDKPTRPGEFRHTRQYVMRGLRSQLSRERFNSIQAISRKEAADYIASIGDYSDRFETYPLAFNVRAYDVDLSPKNLWNLGFEDYGTHLRTLDPGQLGAVFNHFANLVRIEQDDIFDIATEQAWSTFSSAPYFPSVTPDIGFTLRGRRSGNLVITSMSGFSFKGMTNDQLVDKILARDGGNRPHELRNEFVARLYVMCKLLSTDATPAAAKREVERAAAEHMWANVFDSVRAMAHAGALERLRREHCPPRGYTTLDYADGAGPMDHQEFLRLVAHSLGYDE